MLHLRISVSGYEASAKVNKWAIIEVRSANSGVSTKDVQYKDMSEESKRLFDELLRDIIRHEDENLFVIVDELSKNNIKALEERLILESDF